jgi:nitric oxide reductase NorE protein
VTPAHPAPSRPASRLPGDLFIWYVILLEGATFAVLFVAFAFTRLRHRALFTASQQQLDLSAGALNTALLLTARAWRGWRRAWPAARASWR